MLHVNLASTLEISCVAIANEPPTIKWYKGNEEITMDSSHTIQVVENRPTFQITSTLKIYPVAKATDGRYTCRANNSLGSINYTSVVHVFCEYYCFYGRFLFRPDLVGETYV